MQTILESTLLGEFIDYIKANWSGHSRVDQRRRRLRQLVAKVRAVTDAAAGSAVRDGSLSAWLHVLRSEALRGQEVLDSAGRAAAVAGSARRFVAGLRGLFVCSAEVDQLTEAVEELERLAGPSGDLDLFVKVLRLDSARTAPATADMDVDGPPAPAARHRREESGSSCEGAASVAALLPAPGAGAKRKRAAGAGAGGSGADDASTSRGEVDTVQPQKRRLLVWIRTHQLPRGLLRTSPATAAAGATLEPRPDGGIGDVQGQTPHREAQADDDEAPAAAQPRTALVSDYIVLRR